MQKGEKNETIWKRLIDCVSCTKSSRTSCFLHIQSISAGSIPESGVLDMKNSNRLTI